MHCAHRNPAVPPSFDSAMIVKDSLVHEVDVTRFLFDEEIASVQIIKPHAESGCTARVLQDPQIAILRTASGKHVDVEVFVTTGVAYEVRTEVVGETGQRHDRSRRRTGAQDARPGTGAARSPPASGNASDRPTTSSSSAGSTPCRRPAATTSTGRRVGRLRRGGGLRSRCPVAGERRARRGRDGRPRVDQGGVSMKIALDPTPFHHDYELLDFPRAGRGIGLRVPAADAAPGLHPVLQPPARRRRPGRPVPQGVRGRGCRHRVGAAGAALVRARRGRPRSRGAQLEARHPDHRRPRRQRDQHRVLRPPRAGRGIRTGVLPLDGGAGADLRTRGHRRPDRPAPRRFRRGRAGGAADHPRRQLAQHRHGLRRLPQLSTWAAT